MKICSIENCGRAVQARQLCQQHYNRLLKTGELGGAILSRMSREGLCAVDGCGAVIGPNGAKGYCLSHYLKFRKYGNPVDYEASKIVGNDSKRLWSRVDRNGPQTARVPTRCWVWTGSVRKDGYASTWYQGQKHLVHRIFYTMLVGQIPQDMTVDHLCFTKLCVNVEHYEIVSLGENSIRAGVRGVANINKQKTHCPQGHEYTKENTAYHQGNGPNKKRRVCRTCLKLRYEQWKQRKREQNVAN